MRKLLLALLVVCLTPSVYAFTQSGFGTVIDNTVPMGHEWITRRAAIELLVGTDPIMPPDPNDPRKHWTQGLAKNLDLQGAGKEVARLKSFTMTDKRYQSGYRFVFDGIVGERWVDIGGFNVLNSNLPYNENCWDAVAQEPAEIQYDHHMRRYDEAGGEGSVNSATNAQQRFVAFFVAAATAPHTYMYIWDGGAGTKKDTVDRNYFLFGRAAHLLQDSFSSEHTIRFPDDKPERVRQVKSYLCAYGSEQHTHSKEAIFDYSSGDVIWTKKSHWSGTDWTTYKPSNMTPRALLAMEATKDLWAAFIRTMAVPAEQRKAKAEAEAQTLVKNWLSFDRTEMTNWYEDTSRRGPTYVWKPGESGNGQSQSQCMMDLGVKSGLQSDEVKRLEKEQKVCLFNTQAVDGYADLFDPQIHMFYNWKWVSLETWYQPPPLWPIPQRPADTGRRVAIKSVARNATMEAPLKDYHAIHLNGLAPVDFILVGDDANVFIRARLEPSLFLSYAATDGTVMLWNGTENSSYKLASAGTNATSIMNLYYKEYMWAKGHRVRLTSDGKPANTDAQWVLIAQP